MGEGLNLHKDQVMVRMTGMSARGMDDRERPISWAPIYKKYLSTDSLKKETFQSRGNAFMDLQANCFRLPDSNEQSLGDQDNISPED